MASPTAQLRRLYDQKRQARRLETRHGINRRCKARGCRYLAMPGSLTCLNHNNKKGKRCPS